MKKITYLAPLMLMFFIAFTGIVHSETASPVKVTSITASDTKINKSTIFTVTGENLPELFGKKKASKGGDNYNNFDFNDSKTSWGKNPTDEYGVNVISSSTNELKFTLDGNISNYTAAGLFKLGLSPNDKSPTPIDYPYYYQGSYDLKSGVFYPAPLIPEQLKGVGKDSSALLSWNKNEQSDFKKYNIYQDGKLVTSIENPTTELEITKLINGTKYEFQISAVDVLGHESFKSDPITIVPNGDNTEPTDPEQPTEPSQPTGNRAIMVVTMTTGLEKEFDLSMKEVNDFIGWYESKQAGSGSASYAINKHDNNKGPFSSRKDYMLYDRILTFEVSEYSK
ncbi:fibronectin type III domain-containing protein [Paenibacillus sp. 203]|uniref:fibronectin type III domain-containing protein n=1 Tax=Paenibacillus sp. 203 TaxID=3096765 RepID=UPI00300AE393